MGMAASVNLSKVHVTPRGEQFLTIKLTTHLNNIPFSAQVGHLQAEGEDLSTRKEKILKFLQSLNVGVERVEITTREVIPVRKAYD